MMFILAQYYRPPFPNRKHWDRDFDLIKKSGLDGIQLWACWGWIEPEPGVFKFDDYDELIKKASEHGLKVVISTIAEIHPFWIHRVVPDSHMIDHMGNRVVSSLRAECNIGLTPGGCFDNPKVQEHMGNFISRLSERYSQESNLIGWDCWNELRWSVDSCGHVCYCPHTIKKYREWLKKKYTGIEGLNKAWKRRYYSWDDVFPGKLTYRPFTDFMEFNRFLAWRAAMHMKYRHEQIRRFDKTHIVSAHGPAPSIYIYGKDWEQPMSRGNDWEHADQLDGFGSSHFPTWFKKDIDEAVYGIRVESVRSAARNKTMWVSELQGGAAGDGFGPMDPVDPREQQLWIWNGVARGAKGIIFWCWRDEVFGYEASGFGLAGNDGLAEERLKEMKITGDFMREHSELLDNYVPDASKIGVLFEPDNYQLHWALYGDGTRPAVSLTGYLYALERLHLPYEIVESNHVDILDKLKILIMPWPFIVSRNIAEKLHEFVSRGGTILCEGEFDAYDSLGFYRYPGEERECAASLGIKGIGRRLIKQNNIKILLGGKRFMLKPADWFTPLAPGGGYKALSLSNQKDVLAIEKKIGKGKIYNIGAFLGINYRKKPYADFDQFVYNIVSGAGALPIVQVKFKGPSYRLQWRSGNSGDNKLLFLMNYGGGNEVKVKLEDGSEKKLQVKPESASIYIISKGLELLK